MQNKEIQVLESIRTQMQQIPGHLGFYYKNLVTGFEYGVGEDEIYSAASVIKLPLFLHILQECAKGNLSLDDCLVTEDADKVPGCGAIKMLTGAVETDIRSLCRLMICISDNTATNRLIRHCTIPAVEKGFLSMGLEKTKIRRLLFDDIASAAGIQNTICLKELGTILEQLYRETFIDTATSKYAVDVLLKQQITHKLDGRLRGIVPIAHKTGESSGLSNDVGIVYAPQPFVICFAGHDTDVYRWEDLMRRSTYELYQAQMINK